jgi:4-amino-4-deoxychorismate lyase
MRISGGNVEFLAAHISRMQRDTAQLYINGVDWQRVLDSLEEQAAELGNGVLKTIITRGEGGRGYGVQGVDAPHIFIYHYAEPAPLPHDLELAVADGYLASQPLLAGAKHNNRLENILFKRQAEQLGVADVICLDAQQRIIETSSANIFVHVKGRWLTPKLDICGVAGVMREQVLACFALHDIPCEVLDVYCSDLFNATSVFMCNAVRHLVPIHSLKIPLKGACLDSLSPNTESIVFDNTPFADVDKLWQQYLQQQQVWSQC